eukprot:jgi/Chlat1/8679/Chrsp88S08062
MASLPDSPATEAAEGGGHQDEGNDGDDIEAELEAQLADQKEALQHVQDALVAEPGAAELAAAEEELASAVASLEEALLELRQASSNGDGSVFVLVGTAAKARLLEYCDAVLATNGANNPNNDDNDDDEDDGNEEDTSSNAFRVGDWAQWRDTDGRWYPVVVMQVDDGDVGDGGGGNIKSGVRVRHAAPTEPRQLICRFYQLGRCRFDAECRYSHGLMVSSDALHAYKRPDLTQLPQGTTVLARTNTTTTNSNNNNNTESTLFAMAELQGQGETPTTYRVAFVRDGRVEEVEEEFIVMPPGADRDGDSE